MGTNVQNLDWVLPAMGALVAIAAGLAVIFKGVKWVVSTFRKVSEFLEDWRGEDARPGHARQPGVPERLSSIEERLKRVENEVKPNGGGSLRDVVDRIETQTGNDPNK